MWTVRQEEYMYELNKVFIITIITIICNININTILYYNVVMISTEVEDIDGAKGFWKTIQPFLLIGLLVYIVKYFWENRP